MSYLFFVALADDYTPEPSNDKGGAKDLVICPCSLLAHLIWSCDSPFASCVSIYEALFFTRFGLALLILLCVVFELPPSFFVALADDYTPAPSNDKGGA